MNTIRFSRSKTIALICILLLVLAACKPSSASSGAAVATSVPKILQYTGSGISVNAYDAVLKAGIARFHVTAEGALTIDVSGPDGFNSQVLHLGGQGETVSEVQIPADGTYQISIDHAGLGNWKVVVDMSGGSSAPAVVPSATLQLAAAPTTEPPAATSEPVRPTDTPASVLQFNGTGISVNYYLAAFQAGTARFHLVSGGAMTVDIGSLNGLLTQLMHSDIPAETVHEVQIPADGTYGIEVNHAGASAWTMTIESGGTVSVVQTAEPPAATPETTAVPPASLVYKGSGMSVWEYSAVLRAGNALFVVEAPGVLTVDIDGPSGYLYTVDHPGLSLVTKTNVKIPVDGTYHFTISHVGSTAWKVTITQ